MKLIYIMSLTTCVLLAAFLIFYHFGVIPPHLSYDEVSFTRLALSLEGKEYTPYSPLATGHSTLYFYILLSSLKLFGLNTIALRLPSAIFGLTSVIAFYLLMRQIIKHNYYATLATIIFLSMRWFLNFARFSFEATFLLALELIALYFLYATIQKRKNQYAVLCGIFTGLAFLSYYPGRIFVVLPLFIFVMDIPRRLIMYFLIPFVLIVTPLALYYTNHHDIRVSQVSVLYDNKLNPLQKSQAVGENIKKLLLMFHAQGDMNGRHNFPGKPALNPILGVLFLVGFMRALIKWKDRNNQLFLLYFILSVLPVLITYPYDNPNMLRTFSAIPSIVYFVTIACVYIQTVLSNRKLVLSMLITILTISSLYELRTYFVFQSRVMRNSFEVTCPLSELMKMKDDFVPKRCRVSKNLF